MKLKDKKIRFIAETRTVNDHGFVHTFGNPYIAAALGVLQAAFRK